MRVIQSPGVELREIDLSLNPAIPAGTNLFLAGFANKGPTDEILQITSVPELEQIYGEPTTPAERYFYFTARQILQDSPGNLFLNRLPYGHDKGAGFGSKFGALVYPAGSITQDASGNFGFSSNLAISAGTYVLGQPKFFELTQQEYLEVLDGSAFTWAASGAVATDIRGIADFGKAGMIVLNPGQTTINARGEGYYVALTDNTNAEPTSNHDSITHAYTVTRTAPSAGITSYTEIPSDRLYFSLTASNDAGAARDNSNLSLNIERAYYGFADSTTRKFDDLIALNVYKLRRSPYTPEVTKLEYTTQESYLGSLDMHRKMQDPRGGPPISNFLGGQTAYIKVVANDSNSTQNLTFSEVSDVFGARGNLITGTNLLTTTNVPTTIYETFFGPTSDVNNNIAVFKINRQGATANSGPYTVSLRVTDSIGATADTTFFVSFGSTAT